MPPPSHPAASTDRCTPKSARRPEGRTLALPVLAADGSSQRMKRSKMGKRRAIVLALVHVVFAVHIIQWIVTGLTVSPVEPSESMYTLETGTINAGFVFFVLAIISTIIFGRFFCGWGCHVVALQDLCGWALKKVNIRPRPFRSRLLIWVPLGLALYMFVWPTLKRAVLTPLIGDDLGRLPPLFTEAGRVPGLAAEFMVEDFWATFAQWYVAIPFLLICGFAAVYFLGAKGFCTYGCPYGGFFAPIDKLALGKIRVTDACNHCGHCTANCTSNVRIHEEVRDFGMVVDPGCMKCLDCISVCPNDALYFGLGKPTILADARDKDAKARIQTRRANPRQYDMTRREEIVIAAICLVYIFAFRGFLNETPLLMAVGMAGVASYITWKLWRFCRSPNVRLHNFSLRYRGRVRPAGWAFAVMAAMIVGVGFWSAAVKAQLWRADYHYRHLDVPLAFVERPEFSPTPRQAGHARAAIEAYTSADAPTRAGFGWPLSGKATLQLVYLNMVVGDRAAAEAALRRFVRVGAPRDDAVFKLVSLMQGRGASEEELVAAMEDALRRHPRLASVRDQLAAVYAGRGEGDRARSLWDEGLRVHRRNAPAILTAARFYLATGDTARAGDLLDRALDEARHSPHAYLSAAGVAAQLGMRDRAVELAEEALGLPPGDPSVAVEAAHLLMSLGLPDRTMTIAADVLGRTDLRPQTVFAVGNLYLQLDRIDLALGCFKRAAEMVALSPYDGLSIGNQMRDRALALGDLRFAEASQRMLLTVRDLEPDAPLVRHDLGLALLTTGDPADTEAALTELKAAAGMAPDNPALALRLADVYGAIGRPADAAQWRQEAQRRQAASAPGLP